MSATFAALVVSALPSLSLPRAERREACVRFVVETTVTTQFARAGDPVALRVSDAFVIDGIGIPRGSRASGVVARATRPGRIRGRGSLAIEITSVSRPDGTPVPVSGRIVALPWARPQRLPPEVEGPILLGMAAGYATAALISKVTDPRSEETIVSSGIVAGLTTGILAGVLKRGNDLALVRGAVIEVPIRRAPCC